MWFRSRLDLARALAASLAVVLFFIGLMGIVFLPSEAQQLANPQYVTVTHSLHTRNGQSAVSLFSAFGMGGAAGWRQHLAIHRLGVSPPEFEFPCPLLNPLAVAPGPDADHVLVGDCEGTIYLLDLHHPAAQPIRIGCQPDGGVIKMACSADGRFLVSQNPYHLCAWNLATRTQRWSREDVAPYSFSLRPDCDSAILCTHSGELIEVDLADGRTLRTLACYRRPARATALSADGRQLAVVVPATGNLRLLDSHTGAVRWDKKHPRICLMPTAHFLTFSPSGQLLVTAGQDRGSDLTVWCVATGQPIKTLRGRASFVNGAAFAADGSLRSWGNDGTIRIWDLDAGIATRVISLLPPPKGT